MISPTLGTKIAGIGAAGFGGAWAVETLHADGNILQTAAIAFTGVVLLYLARTVMADSKLSAAHQQTLHGEHGDNGLVARV